MSVQINGHPWTPPRSRGGKKGSVLATPQLLLALALGLIAGSAAVLWATESQQSGDALTATVQQDGSPIRVAVQLSREAFPGGAVANVLLTGSTPSADALPTGGLQGLLRSPLLLTDRSSLSVDTAAEIDRLGHPNIHILGGDHVVSAAIEQELQAAGHLVHRHAGPTRIETAISIAERHFAPATAAVLAPTNSVESEGNEALSEAIAAGALAASRELPVLFTGSATLSSQTKDYLSRSSIKHLVVVGDHNVIAESVLHQAQRLGIRSTRLAGVDRFDTAAAVAAHMGFPTAAQSDAVLLVDASLHGAWPAAYIAPLHAVRWNAPILFADGPILPPRTQQHSSQRDPAKATLLICMPGVDQAACRAGRVALGLD